MVPASNDAGGGAVERLLANRAPLLLHNPYLHL